MIRVRQVGEADYGCEEHPEGTPEMVCVELVRDGETEFLEIPEKRFLESGIVEGSSITEKQLKGLRGEL